MELFEQQNKSFVDVVQQWVRKKPHDVAFQFLPDKEKKTESITYQMLAERAQTIAAHIQQQGIMPGERALLIYPPGLELINAFVGCLYAGIVAVLVFPPTNERLVQKLERTIKDSRARLLLSTVDTLKKLRSFALLNELQAIATNDLELLPEGVWTDPHLVPDHLAYFQYTSGSTGNPKAVMITHGNLLHHLHMLTLYTGLHRKHISVFWVPPYHDLGLVAGILQPLYSGNSGILMSPLKFLSHPLSWLQCISENRASISGGPNFAYDYCVKKITPEERALLDLSGWEIATNGAEPIYAKTLERFYEAFKNSGFSKKAMLPAYGLAEATLVVSAAEREQGYKVLNVAQNSLLQGKVQIVQAEDPQSCSLVSCGPVIQEVCIVDPKTRSLSAPDEVGEVWVHGPSVGHGYWQHEQETQETFHAHIDDAAQKSYLRTGDLGFLWENQLYITGRQKDLIILHGVNYYPQDIEYTVCHCHPLLREGGCAAFAVSVDGEERLFIICECEIIKSKQSETDYFTLTEIIGKAVLEQHALPVTTIILIPPRKLPKTTSGKVRRRYTRELVEKKQLPLLYHWSVETDLPISKDTVEVEKITDLESELCAIYSQLLGKNVKCTDNFFSLGGDSLLAIQLMSHIQKEYGVEIALHEFFECSTVADMASRIEQSNPGKKILSTKSEPRKTYWRWQEVAPLFVTDTVSALLSLIPGFASWTAVVLFLERFFAITPWSILAAPVILCSVFILSIFFLRLLLPRLQSGCFEVGLNRGCFAWLCHRALTRSAKIFGLLPLMQSMYLSKYCYWRALGARVPLRMNVSMDVDFIDFPLITIGKNTMIGSQTAISCHVFVGKFIYIKPVNIGNDVFIGAHTSIGPGADIRDHGWIGYGNYVFDKVVPEYTRIKSFSSKYEDP